MTGHTVDIGQRNVAGRSLFRFAAGVLAWRSRRWFPWFLLAIVCGVAFTFRCLHLLRTDHYYILSADSYYFHRMADLVASGDRYYYPTQGVVLPYWLQSGLVYPVGLLAKVIVFISGAAPHDAVTFVAKFLPPTIAVITIVCLWLVVSRMCGRAVALLSSLAWAVAIVPVFFGAAGYLDRDGISLLLVTAGVSVFYLMRDLHLKKYGLDLGWVIRGASVVGFEVLLYIEWTFLGGFILLTILAAYVIGEVLANMWPRLVSSFYAEKDPLSLPMTLAREGAIGVVPAIRESSCKAVMLALAVSTVAGFFRPGFAAIYNAALPVFHRASAGSQSVGELQGIGPVDILSMQFLIVPLLVGMYITITKRRTSDVLWLSWFVVLFASGLFAKRLFFFAAPAFCVLCGIGLGAMLDLKGARRFSLQDLGAGLVDSRTLLRYLRAIVGVILIAAVILVSASMSYHLGSGTRAVAVTPEWQKALAWLRENTPEDNEVKIMTWWDYGYWVLDLAHRVPVVDNGVHWASYDRDIARVYCATSDADAVEIMEKYGARYLVFSGEEIAILSGISEEALGTAYGDGKDVPRELRLSLFYRSLNGQTEFGGGLKRVYPGTEIADPSVVILALD
jgi:asparagine N-glycosylation enzyme membrane subunit Stt3